jgi:hypothetical protein
MMADRDDRLLAWSMLLLSASLFPRHVRTAMWLLTREPAFAELKRCTQSVHRELFWVSAGLGAGAGVAYAARAVTRPRAAARAGAAR